MTLKEYRRKRKFHKTPEPEPKKVKVGKGPLRFVIQKHAATREHYDLRLEWDGSYKSWAVPRGPTLTSGDPRLAVQVEEHPLEYGDFEGVIPKNNYGAGTVMIWDYGTLVGRGSEGRKDSEKEFREGFAKGHLTFLLDGQKLQGEFALVRIKKKGAPANGWLLVKKHDVHASRFDVLSEDRSAVTGRTLDEIEESAEKDGDVWIPGKGRRKSKGGKSKVESGKLRVEKRVRPQTREEKALKAIVPGKVDEKTRKLGVKSGLPRRLKPMEPVVSAGTPADGKWIFQPYGLGPKTIAEVDGGLVHLHSRSLLSFDAKFPATVKALKSWGKRAVLDGEIERSGAQETFWIADVLFLDGKDLRDLSLSLRLTALAGLKFPAGVALMPQFKKMKDVDAAEVAAKNPNSPYRPGLSRYWLRFKTGKAALGTKPSPTAVTEDRPLITHPDKMFWPKEKITKGDLAAYYESVADYILPHLKDRPQSMHRQPDGIKNEGFFHKDQQGYLPKQIETVKVFSGSSDKTINYAMIQDKWSLLYLINLGCIELNPWLSRTKDLEKPDLVVIDLDPDDSNTFKQVIEVAKEVKRVLDKVGATSYCKTSGASGLHICIPTAGRYGFDLGREFAEHICRVVHAALPKFTSVERNPQRRRGKIYLDFLQNRRGQTLAAPYCVRPRPGATVSTPLEWSEVKPGLDPKDFTIANTPKRLAKKGDLWKPLLGPGVNLEASFTKLRKTHPL